MSERIWKLHTFKRTPQERARGLQAWCATFTLPDGRRGIGSGFTERTAVVRASEAALRLEPAPPSAKGAPTTKGDDRG